VLAENPLALFVGGRPNAGRVVEALFGAGENAAIKSWGDNMLNIFLIQFYIHFLVEKYPIDIREAVGEWFNQKVIVCGGKARNGKPTKQCFQMDFSEGTWQPLPHEMQLAREGAAAVVINDQLWISGGRNEGLLNTSEILNANGEWMSGPELPLALADHCLVSLDNDTLLLAGGEQEDLNDPLAHRCLQC